MTKERKIIVNAIGGLANRVRTIAAGINLARATGRRLTVVWRNNRDLAAEFCDLFQPLPDDVEIISPSAREYFLKWEMPRKQNLYLSGLYQLLRFGFVHRDSNVMAETHDDDSGFTAQIAAIQSGDVLIISGSASGGFLEPDLREVCRPSQSVDRLLTEKTASFDDNTVGVHIRRTDHVQSISGSPDQLFIDEMDRRIDNNTTVKFFVATDDPVLMQKLVQRYGLRVMCGDGNVSRRTRDGMLQGAADMLALASTKEIIGSYRSSYSDTAALIGNIPLTVLSLTGTPW
ncbi:MAG: hypothetical protein NC230_07015 [Bacteroides sp.]|nr:hypothetical protein [Bacteroides sp.]MCM1413871.1 hypothetical protein [Bacteroides sp.]